MFPGRKILKRIRQQRRTRSPSYCPPRLPGRLPKAGRLAAEPGRPAAAVPERTIPTKIVYVFSPTSRPADDETAAAAAAAAEAEMLSAAAADVRRRRLFIFRCRRRKFEESREMREFTTDRSHFADGVALIDVPAHACAGHVLRSRADVSKSLYVNLYPILPRRLPATKERLELLFFLLNA